MIEPNNEESEVTAIPETPPEDNSKFTFNERTLTAAASYVGPLIIVPFITSKDDAFTKFHIKQGILVFVPTLIIWWFSGYLYGFGPIIQLLHLFFLVLSIIGIVNALQEKESALPIIGHFANRIKL